MVIWLIGLAGAGKTTVGREVCERLRREKPNVVFLDGDHVRAILGDDLGHTLEDRRRNAWRICRLCQFLDRQGIDVVCAILSLFHEHQDWNRVNYSDYFEVFIDVPLAELTRRDQKGLYSGAIAGTVRDVAGMDLPFQPPRFPDLVLENGSPLQPPDALARRVVEAVRARRRGGQSETLPLHERKSA